MKIVFRKGGTYLMKTLKLYNGIELPAIGFGTYLSTDGNGISAIQSALECVYRYFDTASFYQNEEELGSFFSKCNVPRNELQICSNSRLTTQKNVTCLCRHGAHLAGAASLKMIFVLRWQKSIIAQLLTFY